MTALRVQKPERDVGEDEDEEKEVSSKMVCVRAGGPAIAARVY